MIFDYGLRMYWSPRYQDRMKYSNANKHVAGNTAATNFYRRSSVIHCKITYDSLEIISVKWGASQGCRAVHKLATVWGIYSIKTSWCCWRMGLNVTNLLHLALLVNMVTVVVVVNTKGYVVVYAPNLCGQQIGLQTWYGQGGNKGISETVCFDIIYVPLRSLRIGYVQMSLQV
jgi:hypothetical protein